jgi:hypothetical protein
VAGPSWENAEGEETAREAVATQRNWKQDLMRQRHQSGKTLERSERLREESRRESNPEGTQGSENLRDQPSGQGQRGSEETDKVANSVGKKL